MIVSEGRKPNAAEGPTALADVLSSLNAADVHSLMCPPHRIDVRLRGRDRFELTLRPIAPKFWRNYTLVSTSRLDLQRALLHLSRAQAGDRAWANAIAWHSPRKATQGRVAALIAFVIFVIPYAIFGSYALATDAPGVDARTFVIGFIAIAVIASYVAWVDYFFGVVRVNAADLVGRWLGGRVHESHGLDAGTWDIDAKRPVGFGRTMWLNLLVGAIDLTVLFLGIVLPVAVVALGLFLAFDG